MIVERPPHLRWIRSSRVTSWLINEGHGVVMWWVAPCSRCSKLEMCFQNLSGSLFPGVLQQTSETYFYSKRRTLLSNQGTSECSWLHQVLLFQSKSGCICTPFNIISCSQTQIHAAYMMVMTSGDPVSQRRYCVSELVSEWLSGRETESYVAVMLTKVNRNMCRQADSLFPRLIRAFWSDKKVKCGCLGVGARFPLGGRKRAGTCWYDRMKVFPRLTA